LRRLKSVYLCATYQVMPAIITCEAACHTVMR
jgi:hypothetical protein